MSDLHQQIATLTPAQRALFEQRLKQRGIQLSAAPIPIRPASSQSSDLPLSFAQQRLWFIQQLDPNTISYNVPCALRLRGSLNVTALQHTLNGMIQRHETLRTTFKLNADKQPIQVIAAAQPINLLTVDLTHLADPTPEVERLAIAAAQRPFDLSQPLLRCALLHLKPTEHVLLLTTHHIISDRWSVGVFLREMSQLYNYFLQASPSSDPTQVPLPVLPIQYADWALWQRQTLQGERLASQIQYWQQQLDNLTVLELPTDRPRPAIPSHQGKQYPIILSHSLTAALKTVSAKAGTTLFTTLLTAFQILLHRYTQQKDIVVGTDVANRDRPETIGLIGLLVNTLVLRTDLSGNPTFRELLERVRQVMAGALSHQDLPFEKLVEILNPDRQLSQMMPLFQVKLDLQLAEVKPLELVGIETERLPFDSGTVKYDLRLNLQDSEQGISGQVEYSTDLFDADRIARLVEHFRILLEGIVSNPAQRLSELPLLTPTEQHQLRQWNHTQQDYPVALIHHLFQTQVNYTPDAIALSYQEQHLSYSCLNAKANQLAHHLRFLGAGAESHIGICLPRTPELVIAMLATLKADAAYVPLDPTYPQERLQWIADDAAISILITQTEIQSICKNNCIMVNLDQDQDTIANYSVNDVANTAAPSNLAYLIYTSGSTGVPKGVAIEHRSTVAFLHWVHDTFNTDQLASVLASTSVCFDLSVFEIFAPLSWSGSVVLVDNILELPALPQAHHLTLLNTVPSAIPALLSLNAIAASVETLNLAGEALTAGLVAQVFTHSSVKQLYNLYGPSEDTTYSTYCLIHPTAPQKQATTHPPNCFAEASYHPSIGQPITNTQAYILDEYLQPVPIGVTGELYLAGEGLARGYYNRPDLTAERFIPNPFLPALVEASAQTLRLYRTGDRARYCSDGSIEYLGRFDHQVKLRGFRIELGEIEAILSLHPQVKECVVAVQSEKLIAYLVTASDIDCLNELRQLVATRLPAYMVPATWIILPELPRLPNGKINRSALLQPDIQATCSTAYRPPVTATEQAIAAIWQTELQVEPVGRDDNFFELGGHSLLAMTVVARISETLGVELPLRTLFQSPTVAELAAQIADADTTPQSLLPSLIPAPDQRHQPFPLTDIQQAYWIGRNEAFELGNVSTHGYREIEVAGLTVAQVEQVAQRLIDRHEMLRVIVQPDGQQRILAEVPPYRIVTHDLREFSEAEAAHQLAELRNRLSHQVLPTDTYPLFDIQAVLLAADKIRFCVSFDVLIGDAWSFQLLGQELALLLQNSVALPPLSLSFRDYVLAERAWRNSVLYQRSVNYWQERLPNLPSAPELPLTQSLSAVTQPHFTRRSGQLDSKLWQALKQQASQHKLTPSGLLLAVFTEVLAIWSRNPQFTLNLTLFNRLPLHPEVNQLIGDFTSSTLLAIDCSGQDTFSLRAQRIQAQLWQDLDHRYVSGVEVLRQLAHRQQQATRALMPVVFTSILTPVNRSLDHSQTDSHSNLPWQSEVVYSLSQTSQVYLDHQVAEINGVLVFNWDSIDDLFPSGLLDEMFAAYRQLLNQLANDSSLWQTSLALSIQPTHPFTKKLPETSSQSTQLLHTLFLDRVSLHPDHLALITPQHRFTYQALSDRAFQLASYLQHQGISTHSVVAVVMEKGWEQIVAVLGILIAGATYLPIDPDLPAERRSHLLQQTETRHILTQSWLDTTLTWTAPTPRLSVDHLHCAPQPTPPTPHPSTHTPHPTPHTLHPTPLTPSPTSSTPPAQLDNPKAS